MKIKICFKEMSDSMYFFPHADKSSANMVAIKIKDVAFDTWLQSDGTVFSSAAIGDFAILDTRDSSGSQQKDKSVVYPEVVHGGTVSKLHFSRSKAGIVYFDLAVSRSMVLCPLDLVVTLEHFFSKPVQDLLTGGRGGQNQREVPMDLRVKTTISFTDSKMVVINGSLPTNTQAIVISTKESSFKTFPKGLPVNTPKSRHPSEYEIKFTGISLSVAELDRSGPSLFSPTFVVDLVDTFDCTFLGEVVSQVNNSSSSLLSLLCRLNALAFLA